MSFAAVDDTMPQVWNENSVMYQALPLSYCMSEIEP